MNSKEILQVFRPGKKIQKGKAVFVRTDKADWILGLCYDCLMWGHLETNNGCIGLLHRHFNSNHFHIQKETAMCTKEGISDLLAYIEKHDSTSRESMSFQLITSREAVGLLSREELYGQLKETFDRLAEESVEFEDDGEDREKMNLVFDLLMEKESCFSKDFVNEIYKLYHDHA